MAIPIRMTSKNIICQKDFFDCSAIFCLCCTMVNFDALYAGTSISIRYVVAHIAAYNNAAEVKVASIAVLFTNSINPFAAPNRRHKNRAIKIPRTYEITEMTIPCAKYIKKI